MPTSLRFNARPRRSRRLAAAAAGLSFAVALAGAASRAAAQPEGRPDRTSIVFGYLQNVSADGPVTSLRWHALTHVAYTSVSFESDGHLVPTSKASFLSRSPELRHGGAAARNGVKVVASVNNSGFSATVLSSVMESSARRQVLIDELTATVADPTTGCDGVSLDLQGATVNSSAALRQGTVQFVSDLASALHGLTPRRELSMYLGPRSVTVYDIAALNASLDFMLYSAYDTSLGGTVQAVGIYQVNVSGDSMLNGIDAYMQAGMPADKIVLTLPLYGRSWTTNTPAYGAAGTAGSVVSWNQAAFDTTWRQTPLARNASGANHYCKWYAEPTGTNPAWSVKTYDDLETLEKKMRLALDWKGAVNPGSRLGGVGLWSLMWIGGGVDPASADPNDGAHSANPLLRRTACEPWSLMEELFAPEEHVDRAETFEATELNPRWTDPNAGPDDLNAAESCSAVMTPAPAGAPAGSGRVAALNWDFTAAPNRLLFKHQLLAQPQAPYAVDYGSALVLADKSVRFLADVHVHDAAPGLEIRLVVKDGDHELERSAPFDLGQPGWHALEWDLADSSGVFPYATAEGGVTSGDGQLDSAGSGARDVAFLGFELSSSAPGAGTISIDRIRYAEPPPPAAADHWQLYE